ncbi:MAG: thiamine-phosphate kinase [Lysobacter sp.]
MTDRSRGAAEFDLIDRIRARVRQRDDVIVGIGDDAAVLQVPPGRQLVVATDTLNAGVHFPLDTAPADIGWKALAVNLSDLAAMGAQPAWCTLSLSLPSADTGWVDAFLDGFLGLAARHDVALVGGDTTRGPLSIGVTVHGFVDPGRVLRRDAAEVGDEVWVSGMLGDAAGALRLLLPRYGEDQSAARQSQPAAILQALRERLDRPTPRVATGLALVGLAHAAIDLSDGLLADLGHVCRASGVAAELQLEALPASSALRAAFGPTQCYSLQAAGGDDYQLCFTAPVSARAAVERVAIETGVTLTRIGRIVAGEGVRVFVDHGDRWLSARAGYVHFAG